MLKRRCGSVTSESIISSLLIFLDSPSNYCTELFIKMSDIAAVRRQLKIKAGSVQRLAKETGVYAKETEQLIARKDKFIADGAEEWDIKNATKMVDESEKMVVDTKTRLDKAVADLKQLIASAKEETNLAQDEELIKAEKIVEETAAL
ncbi:tubulin binding cofactor A [Pholiota conissans]|uniref:Tubulin-specific chaperone A n=1 Tax=Pholiota conissans TaxID=109636 RepID=A0A9P6D880_9AGAR|nr:tubulin binding cofactor A [Pholiota conissans]